MNVYNDTIKEEKVYLSQIVQPGDYIKYAIPEKSFEITPEESGVNNLQSYNTANYKGSWQVLYNDSNYGVQIISSKKVADLTLKGSTGYNNCVNVLNKIANEFVNSDLTVWGRSAGTNPIDYEDKTGNQDFSPMNRSSVNGDGIRHYTIEVDFTRFNDKYRDVTGNDYLIDRKQQAKLYIGPSREDAYKEGSGVETVEDCWLASRYIISSGDRLTLAIRTDNRILSVPEEYNYFGYSSMVFINESDYFSEAKNDVVYKFEEDEWENTNGVRCVLKLKDNLEIVSGDGTYENPYEIINNNQ